MANTDRGKMRCLATVHVAKSRAKHVTFRYIATTRSQRMNFGILPVSTLAPFVVRRFLPKFTRFFQ